MEEEGDFSRIIAMMDNSQFAPPRPSSDGDRILVDTVPLDTKEKKRDKLRHIDALRPSLWIAHSVSLCIKGTFRIFILSQVIWPCQIQDLIPTFFMSTYQEEIYSFYFHSEFYSTHETHEPGLIFVIFKRLDLNLKARLISDQWLS